MKGTKEMSSLRLTAATLALALCSARPAYPQTASELLQKGIYTQETVGDIDAAMKIFQQVVAQGGEARQLAAQAQYRIGLCLMRKGNQAEGQKAFEKVIADYPEQKDLVSLAKQQILPSLKLLPAPWVEGEISEFKLK